jgi:hypothetical protein
MAVAASFAVAAQQQVYMVHYIHINMKGTKAYDNNYYYKLNDLYCIRLSIFISI